MKPVISSTWAKAASRTDQTECNLAQDIAGFCADKYITPFIWWYPHFLTQRRKTGALSGEQKTFRQKNSLRWPKKSLNHEKISETRTFFNKYITARLFFARAVKPIADNNILLRFNSTRVTQG